VQKGFGSTDDHLFDDPAIGPGTGRQVCTWPLENCARHDVYGNVTPQQGVPTAVAGADWTVGEGFEGTLIGLGGHMHPGGIRDEVSLVRGGVEKPIFFSEAVPWSKSDPAKAGTYDELDSWDFSMTVTGSTLGWKVKIKEGDVLRLNTVQDSQNASWYENMGIVVALVAPAETEREDAQHGGPGIDVFDGPVVLDAGLPELATPVPGWPTLSCSPDAVSVTKRLCLRGQVTHGHMAEASNHGGSEGPALPTTPGRVVDQLVSAGFTYGEADLALAGSMGVPQLKLGKPARFWNIDSPLDIWHTWTRCKEPCTGGTGISYPIANGGTGVGDTMDFDSTEIGYGLFFSPASGQLGGPNKSTQEALQDGLFWDFTPSQTGTFSLFCRIHPFMRGVFQVVE
ncbi:MAG: cupredoxin domain-containing protein, partial [Actinomycetota bacterium]